jgi:hypothetical protein
VAVASAEDEVARVAAFEFRVMAAARMEVTFTVGREDDPGAAVAHVRNR